MDRAEAAAGAPARVAVAYHAPVPDDHTLFALDVERGSTDAHRCRGDGPSACTRWPGRGKA